MDTYVARQSGTVGHEILADGEVVAWTVDEAWAAIVVALLNGTPHQVPGTPCSAPSAAESVCPNGIADTEATAREAISHLAFHGLAIRWDLPGEPSQAVEKLVATYFSDGEIVGTLSELACRYAMKALADDHLGLDKIEIPETDSPARSPDVAMRQRQGEIGEEIRPPGRR